jgi:hypothetical protein
VEGRVKMVEEGAQMSEVAVNGEEVSCKGENSREGETDISTTRSNCASVRIPRLTGSNSGEASERIW